MRHATNSLLEEKESNQLVLWISVIAFFYNTYLFIYHAKKHT